MSIYDKPETETKSRNLPGNLMAPIGFFNALGALARHRPDRYIEFVGELENLTRRELRLSGLKSSRSSDVQHLAGVKRIERNATQKQIREWWMTHAKNLGFVRDTFKD